MIKCFFEGSGPQLIPIPLPQVGSQVQAISLLNELAEELRNLTTSSSTQNATATKAAVKQAIRTVMETLQSMSVLPSPVRKPNGLDDVLEALNPRIVQDLQSSRPSNTVVTSDKVDTGYSKDGQGSR